jgi:surfeit locus 1 family protein
VSSGLRIGFILLMLGLTALFVTLGAWQMERLGEKEALIAAVGAGLAGAPVPLETIEAGADYRPVTFSGSYHTSGQVLVFTSLADAKGQYSGPGYWVMTPLVLDAGGTIFVNRGFIPQDRRSEFPSTVVPQGHQDLTGLLRRAETAGGFTPEPDYSNGIDWIRDPQRLAAFGTDLPQPVLPWFVDLPAGAPGELPQGGETVVEFPNNHLGYALTWFGFAIITPVLLGFWLARQRKGRAETPTSRSPQGGGKVD